MKNGEIFQITKGIINAQVLDELKVCLEKSEIQ